MAPSAAQLEGDDDTVLEGALAGIRRPVGDTRLQSAGTRPVSDRFPGFGAVLGRARLLPPTQSLPRERQVVQAPGDVGMVRSEDALGQADRVRTDDIRPGNAEDLVSSAGFTPCWIVGPGFRPRLAAILAP